jgi:hypothetical protein
VHLRPTLAVLLLLASCDKPAPSISDHARIEQLESRVTTLENALNQHPELDDVRKFELVAPALGGDRRFYRTESECETAKQQVLSDAANRIAYATANAPPYAAQQQPPSVSCIPV